MHLYAQQLIEAVSAWEGVEVYLHRFGSLEFRLGGEQIGHIHMGSSLVDIPVPRRVRTALVLEGEAKLHHACPQKGWISYPLVRGDDSIKQAVRLFRLSYLYQQYRHKRQRVGLWRELAELGFSAAVIASFKRGEAKTE